MSGDGRFVFKKHPGREEGPEWPYESGGYWKLWVHGRVLLCCPKCKRPSSVHGSHEVLPDGRIEPSVWHDVPECGFHEWCRLEDWTPPTDAP